MVNIKIDYQNFVAQIRFFSYINQYTKVTKQGNNNHTTIYQIFIKNGGISYIEPIILESYITVHYSIFLIDKDNIKNN